MIFGVLLFVLDRWYKQQIPAQLTGAVLRYPFTITVVLVGLALLWYAVYKRTVSLGAVGWVTFGAMSNIIDVVALDGVIDYLPLLTYSTNIADLMIVSGCLYIVWELVRSSERPLQ